MFDAACRFEIDFNAAHAVLGHLVVAYEPRFRTRKKTRSAGHEDGPAAHDARRRVEGAIAAAGPLADLLIATVIFDEPVAQWATVNGFYAKDGAGGIRIALQAVCDYYGRRQPRHLRVSPPAVPADLSPPEPPVQPEPSGPEAVAECQRHGGAVGDAALMLALRHVAGEGWLRGGGERRDVGLQIAKLAAARWPGDQVAEILNPPKPVIAPKMLVTALPKSQNQAETAPK